MQRYCPAAEAAVRTTVVHVVVCATASGKGPTTFSTHRARAPLERRERTRADARHKVRRAARGAWRMVRGA
eukprot:1631607-Prymnesium_polylepis.1